MAQPAGHDQGAGPSATRKVQADVFHSAGLVPVADTQTVAIRLGLGRVVLDLLPEPSHMDGHKGLVHKMSSPKPPPRGQVTRRNARPGCAGEKGPTDQTPVQ